ncbi:putative membrane protein [Bacillus pseudomycoides]|nr:putative membrane protein [Bacillus pseudomycoides]
MFYLIVQPILITTFFICFILLMYEGENKPSERNYKGIIRVMSFSFIGAIVMLYFK